VKLCLSATDPKISTRWYGTIWVPQVNTHCPEGKWSIPEVNTSVRISGSASISPNTLEGSSPKTSHQCATSVVQDVADVLRISVVEAEIIPSQTAPFTNPAFPNQVEDTAPLRMRTNHESLLNFHARTITGP